MMDVRAFHSNFYKHQSKPEQDNFIIKYTQMSIPTRRRNNKGGSGRKWSCKYFIKKQNLKEVPVCLQTFVQVLCIGRDRLKGVLNRHFSSGSMARENRGGNRKAQRFEGRKQSVINFIKKLKGVESHYCRSKTAHRIYLPSELSIRKLWKMYHSETAPEYQVKESYFRMIFNTKFNLGFGSPRTDVCSKCLELGEKVKEEKNASNKMKLLTELRIHKLRAQAFFKKLREKRDDLLIISFDCQKNLTLPKIPDQSVYYSRQLYMYNFTTVTGDSHSSLTAENVRIFAWTEEQQAKGANQIASAMFFTLNNSNLDGITKIRLVADGCGGQNKNSIMLAMCLKWLSSSNSTVSEMELVFPVVGHSYIPPDRVFARIEKIIRKTEEIVEPDEYLAIFKEHGTVIKLGQDVCIMDWKSAAQEILKPPGQWHFKFNMCKRYILKRGKNNTVTISGEQSYNSNLGQYKSVCKKGKCLNTLNPILLESGISPKFFKLKDVDALLRKHFGEEWKSLPKLNYYKTVLETYYENVENQNNVDDEEPESLCEDQEDIPDLLV